MTRPVHLRSLWLSDVHLGTRACRADSLLALLGAVTSDFLYLVGDIIDVPSLRRRGYWPPSHKEVFRRLLRRAEGPTHVTYVPGNHDAALRPYGGLIVGGLQVRREARHVTADGRRVLILHGDEFDWTAREASSMVAFGDWVYDILLTVGRGYDLLRRAFGWRWWSPAAAVKRNVRYIANFVVGYRRDLARYARQRGADVVVTGHVHRPEITAVDGVVYCNCGDWLESCSALVEHEDGRLELLRVERDGLPLGRLEVGSAGMTAAAILVLAGLGCLALLALARRRVRGSPLPPFPAEWPPVSVLVPLRGADPGLEENLRSVFRLDYPRFEVLFAAEDADDPALETARRAAAAHPEVPSRILSAAGPVGPNPKVNNLAAMERHAQHGLLLVSDSNIRLPAGHLKALVARQRASGAGLVWSLFRGVEARGLGGALESLELNVFVVGGACAVAGLLRRPCAIGKSMLAPREDLARVGGFAFLGRYLAEDQVWAEEVAARGRPVVLAPEAADNVLGRRTVGDFVARHLRWRRIRRRISPSGYVAEFFLNPVFLALAAWPLAGAAGGAALGAVALGGAAFLSARAERAMGVRRPWYVYPALDLALAVLRGGLWFVPLFSRRLAWRAHRLRIGRRSLLAEPAVCAPVPIDAARLGSE